MTFNLVLLVSCTFHPAERPVVSEGPYIDSAGYRAARERLEIFDSADGDTLISQALSVADDSLQQLGQPAFFRTIEEHYQRYLNLFTPVRRARRPEVRCRYDLVETFRLLVLDPQPFLNALLHTMSLESLSTLDFTVEPRNPDTSLVHVAVTQSVSKRGLFTFTESDLTLSVTRHGAILARGPGEEKR